MHPKAKLTIKNAVALLTGRVMVGALSVFTIAYIGRNITISEFGTVMLAITTAELFSTISDFGFSYWAVREIARGVEINNFFRIGFFLRICIVTPLFFIFSAILLFSYNHYTALVLILSLVIGLLNSFILFYVSIYNGLEKMERSSFLISLQSVIVSSSAIVAVLLGLRSAQSIIFFRLIAVLIMIFIVIWNTRKYIVFTLLLPQKEELIVFFKKAFPFGMFFVGSVIYFQTDSYQISAFLNEAAVGTYQAAMKLIVVLEAIPLVAANALYPTLTKNFFSSKENTAIIAQRLTKYLFIVGLAIGISIYFLSKEIIFFLYSQKFEDSSMVLIVLAFLIPLRFSGHIFGIVITISDSQTKRMIATISAAIFNVCLNAFIIPKYGVLGAASVSILTSLVTLIIYTHFVRDLINIKPIKNIFGMPSLSFCATLAFIKITSLHSFYGAGVGLIFFFSILFVTKFINKTDFHFIEKYMFRSQL